jgi:hypothetical protein
MTEKDINTILGFIAAVCVNLGSDTINAEGLKLIGTQLQENYDNKKGVESED